MAVFPKPFYILVASENIAKVAQYGMIGIDIKDKNSILGIA